jgi:hypothetical protein
MAIVALVLFWVGLACGVISAAYALTSGELNRSGIFIPFFFMFAALVARYLTG